MKGYKDNIEERTLENNDFREVLYTGKHLQLVLMTIEPGDDIGLETHPDNDQFFRFEGGEGRVVIDETVYEVSDGDVVIVPAGARHNVVNTSGSKRLMLYTVYAPPHHKDGTIHATKSVALEDDEDFDGVTTE